MSDIHSTNKDSDQHDDNGFSPLAQKFAWVENPSMVSQVVKGLLIFCAVLFVIDLFFHRHAYFGFEQSKGFYAISGFFAFTIIVLLAGKLRQLIKRPENYYGSGSTHGENYPDRDLDIIDDVEHLHHSGRGPDNAGNIGAGNTRTKSGADKP